MKAAWKKTLVLALQILACLIMLATVLAAWWAGIGGQEPPNR